MSGLTVSDNGSNGNDTNVGNGRNCGHKRDKNSNVNDKSSMVQLAEEAEVPSVQTETDGYTADTETVDDKPERSEPSLPSHLCQRPVSRGDSTFMTRTKPDLSRVNTRLQSSRSATVLRPSSRAGSKLSSCPPISANRKTISRSSRKSRPESSGSQNDRFQSSGSESDTEGTRTRLDILSLSEIEFGGVDITDEKAWDTDLEAEEPRESYDHTGKTSYVEGCKKVGVIPASFFIRHMQDSHLDMTHHGLGLAGVKAMAVSLVSNPYVTKLNLGDNWLGSEGCTAICEMLKENCFIVDLDLSDNKLDIDCVPALTDVILTTGNLTHVSLSGNDFDDGSAQYFADAIMNSKHLEYMDLSHNRLGEEAGAVLGPAISENSSIKHLNLSWNSIRRKGAVCLAMGIKSNICMKKINLSWNGFGVEGALALGDCLKGNAVLEEMDITNNRITAEGAVWIGKGLSVNETLKVLKMSTNPMESPGCYAILAAILRNPSSVIAHLDFSDIQVNKDFHELFKQVKEQLPELTVLHGGIDILKKPRTRIHPMLKLRDYIERHNVQMIDFFNKIDTDKSLSVTREEFIQGLEEIGILLTEEEVEILVNEMDADGDGEINYSELVIGQREFMQKEQKMQEALHHTTPMEAK